MKRQKHAHKHPSTDAGAAQSAGKDDLQGEGNYTAAREFNQAERQFVESGKVEAAARAAAPTNDAEAREMLAAEQEGKRRAKEDYPPPPEATPRRGTASRREPAKDAPRKPG